jgi:hypothetical protein
MRAHLVQSIPIVCVALGLSWTALADEDQAGLPVSGTVMVDEDYFSAGGSAELDKRVEGDAFLSGARVALRGPVKGDTVLAGGDINIADTVGQDLYAAGGTIAISGQITGNARIAGGQVVLAQRGGIAGKATIAAARLQLSGRVGRYLAVYADSVRIDGEVGGDLRIAARSVEIGPDAKIGGRLTYRSPQLASIDPRAVIAGGVTHVETEWPKGRLDSIARAAALISLGLLLLSLLVVGVIMILAFPEFSAAAAGTVRSDPWKSLGLGFALLLCIPAAAILFMVTVIGIPLGIAVLCFYPLMLLLGYLTGALFVGDRACGWLARRRGVVARPAWRFVALALALLLLLLVAKIPFAGGALVFIVLLIGLGAFWIRAYRAYVKQPPLADSARLGLDLV